MSNRAKSRARFPMHLPVFLAPALLVYTVFMVYPLLDSIRFSFFSLDETGRAHFAGIRNYVALFTDPDWSDAFWRALKNNFEFFFIHMLVQNPIGLLLAALLSLPRLQLRNTYRTLLFMPTMLSVAIIGFVWQLILNPLWGVGKTLLGAVGIHVASTGWLGEPGSSLITLALISVWQFIGIPMMLIYAALLGIPSDLEDASCVDGCNHLQTFFHIKLPLILPTLGLVSILTFVGNFNAFDLIYAVKGALAGPNFSSDIMGTLFYRTFFGNQLQQPNATMGATVATVTFFVILLGLALYLFGVQRRVQRYAL